MSRIRYLWICLLLLCFPLLTAEASVTSGTGKFTPNQWTSTQMPNGGRLSIGNQNVYCVQNHIFFGDNIQYQSQARPSWITSQDEALFEKYHYYATKIYSGERYEAAVQSLIWIALESRDPSGDGYQFTEAQNTIHVAGTSVKQEMDQLKAMASKHGIKPSFDGTTVQLKPGNSLVVKDTNGVLESYKEVNIPQGITLTKIDQNSFKITASNLANASSTITFKQPTSSDSTIYYGSKNSTVDSQSTWQKCAYFGSPETYQANLHINIIKNGHLSLKKTSATPSITQNNPFYELKGATYKVYQDKQLSQEVGTLTTNNEGSSNTITLPAGTYYIKETVAPKGYLLDSTIHQVEVHQDETTTFTASETPITMPIQLALIKTSQTTATPLPDAIYRFSYYNQDLKEKPNTPATKEWLFKTDKEGKIYYNASYLVDGDTLYDQGLPLGTLFIQEDTPPVGYHLDDTIYTYPIQSTNKSLDLFKPCEVSDAPIIFTIEKYLTDTTKPIPNVSFTHFLPDGSTTTITTDKQGKIQLDDFSFGEHELQETNVPEPYLIDPTTFTFSISDQGMITSDDPNIQIDSDGNARLMVYNDEPTGSITLKKVTKDASSNLGDSTLSGAIYHLFAKEDIQNLKGTLSYQKDEHVATFTFDAAGNASTKTNLPLGRYYLKEITPPPGYQLDPTIYAINLYYQDAYTKEIQIEKTLQEQLITQPFEIIKVTTTGSEDALKPLPKAEFTVKLKSEVNTKGFEASTTYDLLITDNNGRATSKPLPYGTYIVRETKTPDEYYPVRDFEITIDKHSTSPIIYKVLNDRPFEAYIILEKIDSTTLEPIALKNTTFKIKDLKTNTYIKQKVGATWVDTFKTNDQGIATTPLKVSFGKYQIEEIKAPNGYLISEPIPIVISNQGAVEMSPDNDPIVRIKIPNQPVKGRIQIYKEGEVLTGFENDNFIYETKRLADATFDIFAKEDIVKPNNANQIIYKQGDLVETITTGPIGLATSKELPLGKYRVIERIAPEGYEKSKQTFDVHLQYKNQTTPIVYSSITFKNERIKQDYAIKKLDEDSHKPIVGVTFGIYSTKDIYTIDNKLLFSKDHLIKSAVSNSKGEVDFGLDLPYSDYYIKELKPADGYLPTHQNYPYTKELTITNKQTEVVIQKIDKDTKEPLEGATLSIEDLAGNTIKTFKTTKEPTRIYGLSLEKTYILKEVKHPKGYTIGDPMEFKVDQSPITITYSNEKKYGEVLFKKTGDSFKGYTITDTPYGKLHTPILTSQAIDDCILTIYNADTNTKVCDVKANQTSPKLPIGKYYAIETSTCEGYYLDSTIYHFTIEDDGKKEIQAEVITLHNQFPTITLDFTKRLEKVLKDAYKDIRFGIFDQEQHRLHAICTIDKNGQLIHPQKLPFGSYYLKELTTHQDFQLDETIYPFELKPQSPNQQHYTIAVGTLENKLKRQSIEILKLDKHNKQPLANAVFELYDGDKLIAKASTTNEGIIIFKDIPYGNYILKEVQAPYAYTISKQTTKLVVNKDSNQPMIIYNTKTPSTSDSTLILPSIAVCVVSLMLLCTLYLKKYNFSK